MITEKATDKNRIDVILDAYKELFLDLSLLPDLDSYQLSFREANQVPVFLETIIPQLESQSLKKFLGSHLSEFRFFVDSSDSVGLVSFLKLAINELLELLKNMELKAA